MVEGIDFSIIGLQSLLIMVLIVIGPPDYDAVVTTVVDWLDLVMGVMPGSNGIMDLIRLLDVSLALSVF